MQSLPAVACSGFTFYLHHESRKVVSMVSLFSETHMENLSQKWNRVLLVDDNAIDLFLNRRVLQDSQLSQHIISINSGTEAFEYLTQCAQTGEYPDLILLDINMPTMSGFELLAKCQETGCLPEGKVRVVLLTSSTHSTDRQRAEEYGLQYVEKPFNTIKVLSLLQEKHSVAR